MTRETTAQRDAASREIAPFNPAAAGPELPIDEIAISADELDNLVFASTALLMEKTDNSQETRAVLTLLGAMQPHLMTLKKHCTQ